MIISEDYYHAFLAGIFAGAGYIVESNKEHGEGRSDVVVYDTENSRVAVFEAKYSEIVLSRWNQIVTLLCSRLKRKCMPKNMKMNMTTFYAMVLPFIKKRCLVKTI